MLEGIALLMAILGFIIFRQTTKEYRKMRDINKNGLSAIGTVISNTVMRNLLGGPGFGTAYHTLIQYQPPGAREPYELYIFEHNLVMSYEYTKDSTVELVYDAEAPYRAYSKLEWERALKSFQKAWACFGISGVLLLVTWLIR